MSIASNIAIVSGQVPDVSKDVHKGKYGYYPCDYETYLKLKELNKFYLKGLHQGARWNRWNRKAPQNRVIRRTIRDAKGRRMKREVIGPAPEPEMVKGITEIKKAEDRYYGQSVIVGYRYVVRKCLDIAKEYQKARYPVSSPEQVQPLLLTLEQIDSLLKEVK